MFGLKGRFCQIEATKSDEPVRLVQVADQSGRTAPSGPRSLEPPVSQALRPGLKEPAFQAENRRTCCRIVYGHFALRAAYFRLIRCAFISKRGKLPGGTSVTSARNSSSARMAWAIFSARSLAPGWR